MPLLLPARHDRADSSFMDRETFIRACREGGQAVERALRAMHRDYAGALMREAWHALHDEAEAQDLLQDTLLKAWRRCAGFRGQSELFPWLKQILRNAAIDRLRSRRPESPIDDEPGFEAAFADHRGDLDAQPERQALEAEADRVFRACAERFALEQPQAAAVIRWVAEDGLTPAQVAELLQRSPGATREYISQCRKKARRYFAEWYRLVADDAEENPA